MIRPAQGEDRMTGRRTFLFALPALATLAACGAGPPRQDWVQLPDSARDDGVTDPTRSAILSASYVFAQPASIAGDAAAGAEALARLEYLAVELDVGPRWIGMSGIVPPLLANGRAEARSTFGISPTVPPQQAMNALYGTAEALRAGDRARATTLIAGLTGPERAEAALTRLANFPYMPRAAQALSQARSGMHRMDRDNDGIGRWRL
jgi:hypothetical protein